MLLRQTPAGTQEYFQPPGDSQGMPPAVPVRLDIVGDGLERTELERRFEKRHLMEHVCFHGTLLILMFLTSSLNVMFCLCLPR